MFEPNSGTHLANHFFSFLGVETRDILVWEVMVLILTEKGIKDEDVPARASDPECIGNETIERSFQVYYLDEVPSALAGDGNGNKVEDDVEKDNIIPREV